MEEIVRRLNAEYGFNLTEEEIKLIAGQAEEADRLFQKLHEVDLTGVMPLMKVDWGTGSAKAVPVPVMRVYRRKTKR